MFIKFLALFLILEVCVAFPTDESKQPSVPVPVPVGVHPPHKHGVSAKPPKVDDSDLDTDPSTWWHTWYHHTYPTRPVYYYNVHTVPVPAYTYYHYY